MIMLNHLKKFRSTTRFFYNSHPYSTSESITKYILIEDQKLGTREISYKKQEGKKGRNVLYVPGFMSKMSGTKATSLSALCESHGLPYTRYDPTGLGESRPIRLGEARLSHWIQDAEHILKLSSEPQIVVGSSMGAWISLLVCIKYPEQISGLVLVAPGVNFTQRYSERLMKDLPRSTIEKLEKGQTMVYNHPDYGAFPISLDMMTDMLQHELDLKGGIDVRCPIRIVHGIEDNDVHYMESMDLLHSVQSTDVQLTYVKGGDHRLSTEENLRLILKNILELVEN